MKKLFYFIAVIFICANANAQTAPKKQFPVGEKCRSVMNELTDLHKQTVAFYGKKDYDKAYSPAKKMYDIAETNCQNEKDKRLAIALNVADIQAKRGKKTEAREIFEKNLNLAAEVFGEDNTEYNTYLNSLISLSEKDVSDEKFGEYLLKSVTVKKKVLGMSNFETAQEILRTAAFYKRLKDYDRAESLYRDAIAVSDNMPTDENIQKLDILNKYRLYLIERYGETEGGLKGDEIMKAHPGGYLNTDNKMIVNGMAIRLISPAYSPTASAIRAKGEVKVEVVIGEDGKVESAKAVSGNETLRDSCEKAAKASVFLPTYVDGKKVKVNGVIIYNIN